MRLITITGCSGTGKTVLEYSLRSILFGRGLTSTTTRLPRVSDRDGEYEHVTGPDFERAVGTLEFLTWITFNGNSYGTRVRPFREMMSGLTPCFRPITPDVIPDWFRASGGSFLNLHLLSPDEDELFRRIVGRDGNTDDALRRIAVERDVDDRILRMAREGYPIRFIPSHGSPEDRLREAIRIIRENR